jgi:hypothetical protein
VDRPVNAITQDLQFGRQVYHVAHILIWHGRVRRIMTVKLREGKI